jgi:hypothetical protein
VYNLDTGQFVLHPDIADEDGVYSEEKTMITASYWSKKMEDQEQKTLAEIKELLADG